jgi:hypothetical protein
MAKSKTEPDAADAPAAADAKTNETADVQSAAPEAPKPDAAAELPDNCIRMRFPEGTVQIGLPWGDEVVILEAEDDGTIVVPEDAEPQLLLAGLVRA